MKVTMHSNLAHPDYSAGAGDTIDLPLAVAEDLIANGYASAVGDPDGQRRRPETVTEATVAEVISKMKVVDALEAVGSDADLAADVLVFEEAGSNRTTLIEGLTQVIWAAVEAEEREKLPAAIAALHAQD